jgi:hypothetical protein
MQLKHIMPAVILVCAAADATVRVLPFEIATPSAFLAASRWLRPDKTLVPNQRFHVERAYGELIRLGNLHQNIRYRSETFTTDASGYRNPPDAAKNPVRYVVTGDSFALGMGVNDEETFSARLTALTGNRAYNGALVLGTASLERIRAIARAAGVHRGTVIYQYANRAPVSSQDLRGAMRPAGGWYRLPDRLWSFRYGFLNPAFQQEFTRAVNSRIEDGVLLPNPATKRVSQERLQDGEIMLVYWQDKRFYEDPSPVDPTVEGLRWLAQELKNDGLDLLVLLTPTGYTVYAPLLAHPPARDAGGLYLAALEGRLREAGITVVNALPEMRARAAEGIGRHQYLYWMDDAHWNPRGIDVTARLVAERLHALQ